MTTRVRYLKGVVISFFLAMGLLAGYGLDSILIEAAEPKGATKFPTKPIMVLNSSPAGSPADVMARQVAQYAKKYLGQPMVIVTKPGGSGGVMFAGLLSEPADGYTISTITAALITSLHGELKKDFSFDQFEYIANVQREPYAVAVRGDNPSKTLGDLIDYSKKNPRLKIGGQGTASQLHLAALALAEETGIRISWVPFGGGADAITNLLGNHIPVLMSSPTTAHQYVETGQLRILAVTSDQRLPFWKNVPTLKELGYNIVVTQYRGFGARKGLPSDVKAKLVDAIKKAVSEPGFKDYMAKNHQSDAFMGPEEFTAMVRAEFDLMGKLMQRVEQKK